MVSRALALPPPIQYGIHIWLRKYNPRDLADEVFQVFIGLWAGVLIFDHDRNRGSGSFPSKIPERIRAESLPCAVW